MAGARHVCFSQIESRNLAQLLQLQVRQARAESRSPAIQLPSYGHTPGFSLTTSRTLSALHKSWSTSTFTESQGFSHQPARATLSLLKENIKRQTARYRYFTLKAE